MFRIRKRSKEMCIGHRLINYSGRCRNVHGHAIVVEIEVEVDQLDSVGMAVDFDLISTFLKEIDDEWDHGFLVATNDQEMIDFLEKQHSKYWVCPYGNPTMERLAESVFITAKIRGIQPQVVRVFEKGGNDNVAECSGTTPGCRVEKVLLEGQSVPLCENCGAFYLDISTMNDVGNGTRRYVHSARITRSV